MQCTVYKSPRKAETYLYMPSDADPTELPEALLAQFGTPERVLELTLGAERKLARVNAVDVLEAIQTNGYYMQLPPPPGVPLK